MRDIGSAVQSVLKKYETDEQVKNYTKVLEQMKKLGLVEKPLTPMRDDRIIFPNRSLKNQTAFSQDYSGRFF